MRIPSDHATEKENRELNRAILLQAMYQEYPDKFEHSKQLYEKMPLKHLLPTLNHVEDFSKLLESMPWLIMEGWTVGGLNLWRETILKLIGEINLTPEWILDICRSVFEGLVKPISPHAYETLSFQTYTSLVKRFNPGLMTKGEWLRDLNRIGELYLMHAEKYIEEQGYKKLEIKIGEGEKHYKWLAWRLVEKLTYKEIATKSGEEIEDRSAQYGVQTAADLCEIPRRLLNFN